MPPATCHQRFAERFPDINGPFVPAPYVSAHLNTPACNTTAALLEPAFKSRRE